MCHLCFTTDISTCFHTFTSAGCIFFSLSLYAYSRWQFRCRGFGSAHALPSVLLLCQHTGMITETPEQAGRRTHSHNPTHTLALLGNSNEKKLKLAQDTIFIRSSTHIHSQTRTYTCTGKSDKTGIIEYGMNTQAVNDWPQQVCVNRLGSFVSVRPLRVGFRLSCRTPAALHWVPHQSLDTLKTRLCQQVPPLYQLYPCYTHTHTYPPTHALTAYIYTNVLDRILKSIIKIWKRFGGKKRQILVSSIVPVLNVKPYFCIFCNFFLTSALSGTCCYKSKCGTVPTVGTRERGSGLRCMAVFGTTYYILPTNAVWDM